jgi:hypothetical protein
MVMRGRVSPYPSVPREETEAREQPPPDQLLKNLMTDLKKTMGDFANLLEDQTHRVDEYRIQTLAPDANTSVNLQAEYEVSEIITAVVVTGPVGTTVGFSSTTSVPVTSATANQVIATAAGTPGAPTPIPAGTYNVNWSVALKGTLGAADDGNFGLYVGNTLVAQSLNAENAGVNYVQPSTLITVPAGGATVTVRAIGNATVGAVYEASLSLTSNQFAGTAFTLKLGKRVWNLNLPATGILVIAPVSFSLSRSDDRQLSSATSGDWSLELTGFADYTESYRTLA